MDAPRRSAAAKALADELRIPLVSNQPQYSMLWRVIEAEVVPPSEELGMGQIVWSPIAQGVLTGKYLPGAPLPAGHPGHRRGLGRELHPRVLVNNEDLLAAVQRLKPVAEAAGLSLAQLAVAWVLQNPNVSAAIIGASRPEQVSENVKAAGVKLAAEALLKQIDEVLGDARRARPGADGVAGEAAVAARDRWRRGTVSRRFTER